MDPKDFVCGLLAGWAQVLVGQPLDYMKVKIQTNEESKSLLRIAKNIHKQHGMFGFYRGSSSILFGVSSTVALEFLVYEWGKRVLYSLNRHDKPYKPKKLSLLNVGLAGGLAGWSATFVYCPMEFAKIQKQLSSNMKRGSLELIYKTLKKEGLRSVYRGFWLTSLRQFYGTFFYYATY